MRDQTAEALLTVQDIVERRASDAAYSDAIRILETVLAPPPKKWRIQVDYESLSLDRMEQQTCLSGFNRDVQFVSLERMHGESGKSISVSEAQSRE